MQYEGKHIRIHIQLRPFGLNLVCGRQPDGDYRWWFFTWRQDDGERRTAWKTPRHRES